MGRRDIVTSNGVTKNLHYDGNWVTYVEDSNGKIYRFAYDHNGTPIFMSYQNRQYWYHYDEHGNVIRVTDADKNTVAAYQYDAWGNTTYKWGASGSEIVDLNPYRYAGYWYDDYNSNNGMYYLQSRYYDTEIGRFLSKDPLGVVIGSSVGLNAYTYANNNPIMHRPIGEMYCMCEWGT